jgi:phage replication-related protein YjqB (UPF0714/DUF867 family)
MSGVPQWVEAHMADTYPNFYLLSQHEAPGVDFRIRMVRAGAAHAIVAPHGGGIEPGTSEVAEAIAGPTRSFYAFEGLKESGNGVLHITSTRFDEPTGITLVGQSEVVVTVHGEGSAGGGEAVFLGGRHEELRLLIGSALEARGFDVRGHSDPDLQGREPCNLCNRGRSARGVQLEMSLALRRTMFDSLTRAGREHPTERFEAFVEAVSGALDGPLRQHANG